MRSVYMTLVVLTPCQVQTTPTLDSAGVLINKGFLIVSTETQRLLVKILTCTSKSRSIAYSRLYIKYYGNFQFVMK